MEENKEKELDEEVINESINEAVDSSVEPCDNEAAEEETKENKELADAKAKADEYLDKYQRLMAEFYNFRERTSKEKASMYDDGVRDTVEKILPVVDNLERAVSVQQNKTEEA